MIYSSVNSDDCHCKEEVELEEAQALVEALEQSASDQNALPFVPGLSRKDESDTLTIHIQEEVRLINSFSCQYILLMHQSYVTHSILPIWKPMSSSSCLKLPPECIPKDRVGVVRDDSAERLLYFHATYNVSENKF